MGNGTFWILSGVGLILGACASVGTKVLNNVAWHELKELCRRHNRRDLFDRIHDDHEQVIDGLESLQALSTVVLMVGAAGLAFGNREYSVSTGSGILIVVLTLTVVLSAMVWLPSAVNAVWGHRVLYGGWPVFRSLAGIVTPFTALTNGATAAVRRMAGVQQEPTEEEAFEDEVMAIVTEGLHDGLLEADAQQMIEGVFELDDQDVADIMTPRSEVDAFAIDLPLNEVTKFATQCGRTRIPVYEGSLDNIVGILYVKDLLAEFAKPEAEDRREVRELLRQHPTVPMTRPLDELLKDFLRTRNHLAIVVDEYMSLAGLVTIEDVLEEIVGEIVDESDRDEEAGEIHWLDDYQAEINGRAHLVDVNEQLGIQLPVPEDHHTIGGFVVSQLGRIPRVGESVVWETVRITVLSSTKRRVEEVLLESEEGIARSDSVEEADQQQLLARRRSTKAARNGQSG